MTDPATPEVRLDSLIADYLARVESGETIVPEEFISSAPDLRQQFLEFVETSASIDQITEKAPAQSPDVSAIDTSRVETSDETIAPSQTANSKANEFEIPEEFGRYQIKKLLGQGAMGAVYHAFDTQLHREIALKIPKIADDDEEMLERFYREARTAGGIRNANICPVFDVGDIDGQHFISMAFIEGKPLSDYIRPDKPIPLKSVVLIIRKLAIALQEAHELGVVHRDLKPDNIMVDLKHEPVIMDFGLARIENPLTSLRMTQSGMILGTPAYMSPEQVEGSLDKIGAPSDQYAMGVVLYEMTTGKLPFTGSAAAVFGQIMTKDPTPPSELRPDMPAKLEAICLKMMSKHVEDRYTDMKEVSVVLAKYLKNPGSAPAAKPQKTEQLKKSPIKIDVGNETNEPTKIVAPPELDVPVQHEAVAPVIETLRPKKPGVNTKKKKARKSQSPPWWKNRMVQLGGLGGMLLLLGITFLVRVGKYDVQITLDDPSIQLSVDGIDQSALKITDGEDVYKLSAGKHKLQLEKEGFKTQVEEFTVTKDGKTALKVAIVNGKLDALLNGEKPLAMPPPPETPIASNDSDSSQPPTTSTGDGLSFDGNALATIEGFPIDELTNCTIEFYATPSRNIIDKTENVVTLDGNTTIVIPKDNQWHFSTYYGSTGQMCTVMGDRIEAGKRVHLAAVREGKLVRLFVDGGLAWEEEFNGTLKEPVSDIVHIGRFFHGVIDELRISNVARYADAFSVPEQFNSDKDTLGMYHFDEGTGDVFKDSSGNGHHGKILGAKWVRGPETEIINSPESTSSTDLLENQWTSPETALYFSDRTHEVTFPSLKDETDALTIELWLQRDKTHLEAHSKIVGFNNRYFIATSPRGVLDFHIDTHANRGDRNNWGIDGVGKPIHVACVRDPVQGEIRLYIDGKLIRSSPGNAGTYGGKLWIATNEWQFGPGNSHSFSGWIDEVRISRSARYKKEFKPQRRFENDNETAALYHFDEGSGDILKDSSGNGHDGKIIGAKWVGQEAGQISAKDPKQDSPGGLEFDGDDVVHVDSLEFDPTQPFTLEAALSWQYKSGVTDEAVFAGRDGDAHSSDGGTRFGAYSFSHFSYRLGDVAINEGSIPEKRERVHIALVHTGEELLGFRDGKLVGRQPTTGKDLGPGTGRFLIGKDMVGRYEMLRFSTMARYNKDFAPQTRFTRDEDTLALYHFDEGTGDILKDSSGNGHHGKIVGAKWGQSGNTQLPMQDASTAEETVLRFEPGDGVEIESLIDETESLTMELWVEVDEILSHIYLIGPHSRYFLGIENREFSFKDRIDPKIREILLLDTDQWTVPKKLAHLAFVRDAQQDELRLYVDGQLFDKSNNAGQPTHGKFQICGKERQYAAQKGKGFQGILDEIRISSSVRYSGDSFTPQRKFQPDQQTLALYHCDEGSGEVLKDSSGNGHDGKIIGAKWVTAKDTKQVSSHVTPAEPSANNALTFIDEETYVHCPDVVIDQQGPYTVEAWIRDENRRGNLLYMRNGGFPRFIVGGPNHGLAFDAMKYKGVGVSEKPVPESGQWAHVAGVYAEGEVRLYVNGELIGSEVVSPDDQTDTSTDMLIGGRIHGSNDFGAFKGQIDEVRISNIPRYTDNFTPSRRHESDEHTLALYHFDEGKGDVLKDSSGNGHNGKIIGAKWVQVQGDAKAHAAPQRSTNLADPATSGLSFSQPEARVEIPKIPFKNDSPVTIEAWLTKHTGASSSVIDWYGEARFHLSFTPEPNANYYGKKKQTFGPYPYAVDLNRPMHMAVTWDGEKQQLFIDGRPVGNLYTHDGQSVLPMPNEMYIGGRPPDPKSKIPRDWASFPGVIHQVRISNGTLYPKTKFTPEKVLKANESTLALYHINEGAGDLLNDSSGNGRHGKIVGAKWIPSHVVSGAESERTITPANGPVDLVPFIDLERDVSHGSFEKRAGRLLAKGVKHRSLQVPVAVSGDYSFRTSFVQNSMQKHNMEFFFPVGDRAAIVQIKYGGYAKLDPVGVKHEYTPDTLVKAGENDVQIVVRQPTPERGHIEVDLNGTRILDWSGPIESLEENARFEVQSFAVSEDENPISMSLEMLSGRAVFLRSDVTLPRSNKQTNMPAKEDDPSRWPLQTSRPEDIVWLQGLNATLTLRSGPDQELVLNPTDPVPDFPVTIVGVQFDKEKEDGQKVTDETLNRLATLTDLELLVLDFHPNFAAATKDGLPQLSALKNLRYLKLSEIGPEETDPTFLAAFPALQTLNLAYGAKYAWESGVSGSSSIQELKLYHMIPEDLEALAQMPRLTSLILTGRGNSRERREVASKQFATLAPWCRINVYDPGAPPHKATILEPTAPLPDSAANDGNQSPPPAVAPFDEAQAKGHQEAWADYLGVPIEYESSIGMKFRLIPPGEFLMGRTVHGAAGRKDSHKVILTKPVYVGVTEVTQSQYEQVMGTNPSYFSATGKGKDLVTGIETGNYPVERLTWLQAAEFCTKLSQQEKFKPFYSVVSPGKIVGVLEATGYRLPTEAEWEFACRAGTTTLFWCGDNEDELHQVDWFSENSEMHSHMVGELESNPFGLSDMHGNVTEWIQDSFDLAFFDKLTQDPVIDPYSPFSANSSRVRRGGCLRFYARQCSSSSTYTMPATSKSSDVGFRTVLTVNAVQQQLDEKAAASPKPELTGRHGWPADSPAPAVAPFDEKQAKAHQKAWAKHLAEPVVTTNSIDMKFAMIPPGEFMMGDAPDNVKVTLTNPFRLGVHEVTQEQWTSVMETEPWKDQENVLEQGDVAASYVSWTDAVAFCQKLTAQEQAAGDLPAEQEYRLPTDSEWEYACRAGTTTSYSFGDVTSLIDQYAWRRKPNRDVWNPKPVGTKEANPWGLHDVHGNVWEWCADYYTTPLPGGRDPFVNSEGTDRVRRGGSWVSNERPLHSDSREGVDVERSVRDTGFRIVRTINIHVKK